APFCRGCGHHLTRPGATGQSTSRALGRRERLSDTGGDRRRPQPTPRHGAAYFSPLLRPRCVWLRAPGRSEAVEPPTMHESLGVRIGGAGRLARDSSYAPTPGTAADIETGKRRCLALLPSPALCPVLSGRA